MSSEHKVHKGSLWERMKGVKEPFFGLGMGGEGDLKPPVLEFHNRITAAMRLQGVGFSTHLLWSLQQERL